jgi:uncharacterized membrane protein
MNKQLLKDLAELEAAQVISAETSEKISAFYLQRNASAPNRLGIILGILGALLIGSGIILIIAHNWDNFNKLTKTVLAFIPLLAAQLLAGYTLLKQRDSKAWRECSGVLLFLAIPATISVINQVYQVGGNLPDFLLTWMLLALPVVYVLSSSVVALLCIATATWYAVLTGYFNYPSVRPYLYLVMMLALMPHYYRLINVNPKSNLVFILNFMFCISVTITLGSFLQGDDDWYALFFAAYLVLFCIFYYTARLLKEGNSGMNSYPFHFTGIAGILSILFMWSFESLWIGLRQRQSDNLFVTPLPYILLGGIGILIWQLMTIRREKEENDNHVIGLSFVVFLAAAVLFSKLPAFSILSINLWILLIAVIYIRKGSRDNHFGVLNFGLIILGILALCRFFDDSIPFVWRGVFFLATGIAFFVSNYMLLSRRKALQKS